MVCSHPTTLLSYSRYRPRKRRRHYRWSLGSVLVVRCSEPFSFRPRWRLFVAFPVAGGVGRKSQPKKSSKKILRTSSTKKNQKKKTTLTFLYKLASLFHPPEIPRSRDYSHLPRNDFALSCAGPLLLIERQMSAAEDVNGAGFTFNGVPIDPDLYRQAARELYVYFSTCLPFFFPFVIRFAPWRTPSFCGRSAVGAILTARQCNRHLGLLWGIIIGH